MAISVIQNAKNKSDYQVQPLTVTLQTATTAGSRLAVIIFARKTGNPFNVGSIGSNTPAPIVTDDKGNVYTLVDSFVGISQEASGAIQPDVSGYLPSAYIYVSSSAVTAGTQNVAIAAFYPDVYTSPIQPGGRAGSPPIVNGRPVFDGGLNAIVLEVAGLTTGVDVHAHGSSYASALGANLITTSGDAIIIEAGVLIDSSSIIPASNASLVHSTENGSSHYSVQATIVSGATANAGYTNSLRYTGAVIAVSLK